MSGVWRRAGRTGRIGPLWFGVLGIVTAALLGPPRPALADGPSVPSFRNDVLPVLTKAGCNAGACHGALAGKGGFRLSLRGYNPLADWFAITREARGRRVELADPGRSLVLAKPSGALPHKGGLRLKVGSPGYAIVARWIAGGAPPPREDDPRVERIGVETRQVTLQPRGTHQVRVVAHLSDGQTRDVTRWAKFSSAAEAVATVDDAGAVTAVGHGEGAVVATYASRIDTARITVPYEQALPEDAYARFEPRNFIDVEVLAQWKRLHVAPSPPAGDASFLRRAMLDTIGTLPTSDEVRRFLADRDPRKRERWIDDLLARDQFVDYWAYKWSDLLLVNGQRLRPKAVHAYYQWIRGAVAANLPWDQLARQIVLARGSSYEQGATNFYALHQDAESMTENLCQAFLGLSIGCARCHNHPLEKWTNDQYYAMANLFARVRAKGWGGGPTGGDGLRTLFVAARGDLVQPRTGKPQPPTPLDGQPLPADAPGDRREAVARWLTAPENPYFARAIANRVWANFFGVGLVEPVDDLRTSNPASNEKLLTALADYLIAEGYDLKKLMRMILCSSTYGLSSRPIPANAGETRFYTRYYPRRMMAEVMLDAICQVTGVRSRFTQIAQRGGSYEKTDAYPPGVRALELHDSAVASAFLKSFGRNPRNITCECERNNEPTLVQALHLSNGQTINEKLASPEGRVAQLVAADWPDYRIVEEVYLSALGRYPTDGEIGALLPVLADGDETDRRQAVEDLFWSVLTSREFLFHH